MNKDLDTALMLIMGWIAFAILVAAVNLVCVVGNSSNNFSDFQTLIDELEKFGTQWEATEDGVTVFTTILS